MANRIKINSTEAKYTRNFGVEFELSSIDKGMLIAALHLKGISCNFAGYTHATMSGWKIVTDSSLRGARPYELVSPILNGMRGLKELREVCIALEFCGAETNKSCGLHVHHQAPDGWNQNFERNLTAFYARLERTIDAFMPVSRKRNMNRYCWSMVNAYNGNYNPYGKRYHKLNFESLHRHGTVEFRQHGGTIDFEKIYHWIVFTANMLKLCKNKHSQGTMNFIERAWTPRHLKLEKRTWAFFKGRMKKLDDLSRELQTGTVLDW